MGPHHGAALWAPTMGPHHGAAPWAPTMGPPPWGPNHRPSPVATKGGGSRGFVEHSGKFTAENDPLFYSEANECSSSICVVSFKSVTRSS